MMLNFHRRILLITVVSVVIGCSDNSNRMDLKVGLFFAKNTKNLKVVHGQSEIQVGEDIVSTLTGATRRVFASVEMLDSYPTQESISDRQLDLAIIVQHGAASGSSTGQGNGLLNQNKARRTVTVDLMCYSPDMVEVTFVTASGRGRASAQGIVFSAENRARVNAAKSAIHDLGENAARLMNSNPEIRKLVE